MISNKLEKLINLSSSDNSNESEQASKMAVSLMIREGVGFDELLSSSSRFYLEGLVSVAKSYSHRTTKTSQDSQKKFSDLLLMITQTYNTSTQKIENHTKYEEEINYRESRLKKKEKELREREKKGHHQEHKIKPEEKGNQYNSEENKNREKCSNSSHNIKFINNHFLQKCISRPFRTIQLFIISLFYGIFHSFLINLGIFVGIIFFGLNFTYRPGFISFFFIVAFPFMIWKSLKLYRSWY